MERSIQFYKELLGFEIILDKEIQSVNFCKGVGLKDVKARVVMFKLNNDNTLLELFQYYQPEAPNVGMNPPHTVPLSHIALQVTDIDSHYKDLKAKNVEFISEPQKLGDDVIFCYFRDPDGALLELIEFPKK
jgi:catechol 2,3-dioxygenase-like lactoylglutathione lyase family enzyme